MAHLGIRMVLVNDWDVGSGRKTRLDKSPRINFVSQLSARTLNLTVVSCGKSFGVALGFGSFKLNLRFCRILGRGEQVGLVFRGSRVCFRRWLPFYNRVGL